MKNIIIKNKEITIWSNSIDRVPIVYIHIVKGNGKGIWDACQKLNCMPLTLVTIGNLNWDDDMSPWEISPIYDGDNPCKGLAKKHLKVLLEDIIPAVEKTLEKKPLYSVIGGYSLAGLFAMWSLYNTDYFSKSICCSGSFWFPQFIQYVKTNQLKRNPECIYFSLGDKEKETDNKYLKTVEDNTKKIYNEMCNKNIKTIFEMNAGDHFKDADLRMTKGICWTLSH